MVRGVVAERRQPGGRHPASGRLALVQGFINTVDLEDGPDQLETVAGLGEFLRAERLLDPGDDVTDRDRLRAIALREALRSLALANNGAPVEQGTIEVLNDYSEALPMVARFSSEGQAGLLSTRTGLARALGTILAAAYEAMVDGSWPRLKACRNPRCQWVFYDRSKNRSGRWCAMSTCGSRSKARAYSSRHRATQAES
jgi:predicted RNA-binding Zn ribbon-like protein